jgi:hypothetical protein
MGDTYGLICLLPIVRMLVETVHCPSSTDQHIPGTVFILIRRRALSLSCSSLILFQMVLPLEDTIAVLGYDCRSHPVTGVRTAIMPFLVPQYSTVRVLKQSIACSASHSFSLELASLEIDRRPAPVRIRWTSRHFHTREGT